MSGNSYHCFLTEYWFELGELVFSMLIEELLSNANKLLGREKSVVIISP
jgi:hypothetical protein